MLPGPRLLSYGMEQLLWAGGRHVTRFLYSRDTTVHLRTAKLYLGTAKLYSRTAKLYLPTAKLGAGSTLSFRDKGSIITISMP